jgi:putative FmdB family regulatory protein
MPVYEYQAKSAETSCDYCAEGFEILQRMTEDPLAECPKCGAPIQRLLYRVGVATPHTNSELKDLGFTKLVKRDDGVYENVTRSGDESRYMEADKPETMPNFKGKITD